MRSGYLPDAGEVNKGVPVCESADVSILNALEKEFHAAKSDCKVSQASGQNAFVALTSNRGKPEFFVVSNGADTTPVAQGESGIFFNSRRIERDSIDRWVLCGSGFMGCSLNLITDS
ncbi:hypothetical protein [Endozoicomonas sp.]|uniref:hypothetical protein n=1 Tax=Endozoicomonas sp. TaxID=1892382 RepID=UPI003AF7D826